MCGVKTLRFRFWTCNRTKLGGEFTLYCPAQRAIHIGYNFPRQLPPVLAIATRTPQKTKCTFCLFREFTYYEVAWFLSVPLKGTNL